jgi:D-alanine transfer protein
MNGTGATTGRPHCFAALVASGIAAAMLVVGQAMIVRLESKKIDLYGPLVPFQLKNQGLAFQRAAARTADMLPLYGSSELTMGPVAEKGGTFFRTAPTGFQVCPVGKAGMATMIMLHRIGALGSDLNGKKVVISLSPEWFLLPDIGPYWYDGNFSLEAASEVVLGDALDFRLKRDIALRMLQFPATLTKSPLLHFALERLASGRRLDRVCLFVLWPMGKMQNALLDLQDHLATLEHMLRTAKWRAPARHPQELDWPKLIAQATERQLGRQQGHKASLVRKPIAPGSRDAVFLKRMNGAREWADFQLLLRTLSQIRARPLLLSMPIDGQYYDEQGISRAARETYYERVRSLASRYNFPLVDFHEHDGDPDFIEPPHSHLTAKGWMFYNRVLDDFFHNRPPSG